MAATEGLALRRVRGAMGLTQAELGERLGVSARTISQWETAGPPPSRRAVIEAALGEPLPPAGDDAEAAMTLTWSGWTLELHPNPTASPEAAERVMQQIMAAAVTAWNESGIDSNAEAGAEDV